MAKYILALDQGTTSSRAIIFDRAGSIVATAQKEFQQFFPRSGWVEHDANEIWSSQIGVVNEALAKASIAAIDVAAIGITNQRETTIVWNRKTGKPIHPAIVWQDRRTAEACDALKAAGHEALVQSKTGLVIDAYFSGSKIQWLLDNVDSARSQAERGELAFGTVDSWLVWKLTRGMLHITDASNACRTMIFNIHTGDWDDDLLALLDIPRSLLPEVRCSCEVYGKTAEGLLGAQVPIAGIAGDQQAATFGQVALEPGMVKNTYGTGCFMLLNTGAEPMASNNKLLTTVAWTLDNETTYAVEGGIFIAGAVVQWLRDGLGIIQRSEEVETLARSVPDTAGVYLVPAFVGLGAPYWDSYARGTITGLSRGSTAAHIARAALESIAYQTADVLEAMRQDSAIEIVELRVDGGASCNDLLMQFQADLLGIPVVRPKVTETTALGAAYLAGLAVGYWTNQQELVQLWQVGKRFEPNMAAEQRERLRDGWRQAVSQTLHRKNPATQEPTTQAFTHLPREIYSDEPEMESDLHLRQMLLLISCLDMLWEDRTDFYASGNMTVYYSPQKIKNRDFRGPDFMVALDTERYPRKSWVVWEEEGKYPNVIVEILSDSTANVDRTTKKKLYQDTFRTPEYFWVDPDTGEFEGFILVGGHYQAIELNELGRRWSQQLQLFLGMHNSQLRYFTPDGALVPTPVEAAKEAEKTTKEAEKNAQDIQQKNDVLVAKLRELGVDPLSL
ncbi:MAG: glycerol kinase GlpK [Cyanobacteria bacterium J06649_5]